MGFHDWSIPNKKNDENSVAYQFHSNLLVSLDIYATVKFTKGALTDVFTKLILNANT